MNIRDKEKLVSILVMAYNHETYIAECLDSILIQKTNFAFEIILGEDQSNDGTREVCQDYAKRYPEKIKLFLRSRKDVIYINGNATGRYNFLENLKACRGKYIALCEGDDYWTDPLKLQKQVDFLEANSDYSICFHKVQIIKSNKLISDTIIEKRYENIKKFPATVIDLLKQGNFMHTASVVFRNNIRYFPMEFAYSPVGDYFLHIINAQYGYIKRLDEVMAVYRDGVGIYSTLSSENMAKKILQYNSCILSYLSNPEQKEVLLKRQMAIVSGIDIIQNGQNLTIENLHSELSFKNILNVLIRKIKNKFTF